MFTNVTNQVTLIGNLGDDPKFFGEEGQGARFDLATRRVFMRNGEREVDTDWHTVVCWNGLAKSAKKLAKGDRVAIAGSIRTRNWDDRGENRRSVEIHASSLEFLNVKSLRQAEGD